jgi:hypothetical protein
MVVCIDEAGDDSAVRGVDGLIGLEVRGQGGGHGADLVVLDQHVVVFQLLDAVVGIPADDVTVLDEQLHAGDIFTRQPLMDAKEFGDDCGGHRKAGWRSFFGCGELH